MKTTYEIEITNINIDDWYFDFQYKVWINGELTKESVYSNEHAWRDNKKGFKRLLEEGYATQLALEDTF